MAPWFGLRKRSMSKGSKLLASWSSALNNWLNAKKRKRKLLHRQAKKTWRLNLNTSNALSLSLRNVHGIRKKQSRSFVRPLDVSLARRHWSTFASNCCSRRLLNNWDVDVSEGKFLRFRAAAVLSAGQFGESTPISRFKSIKLHTPSRVEASIGVPCRLNTSRSCSRSICIESRWLSNSSLLEGSKPKSRFFG